MGTGRDLAHDAEHPRKRKNGKSCHPDEHDGDGKELGRVGSFDDSARENGQNGDADRGSAESGSCRFDALARGLCEFVALDEGAHLKNSTRVFFALSEGVELSCADDRVEAEGFEA